MLVAGCGDNKKQDVNEPKGTFPLAVERATFPASQKLAKQSRMEIVVRNGSAAALLEAGSGAIIGVILS